MRAGFTLIETLIALAITSVIAIVTLEMLASMSAHALRLEAAMTRASTATLQTLPMRRAIEGTLPDYADSAAAFTGDDRRLAGLTATPALGGGRPAAFTLTLEADSDGERLVYSEDGAPLFSRPLGRGAHQFVYVDQRGARHTVWPPDVRHRDDPEFYIPSPSLIIVADTLDDDRQVAAYAPTADRRPPLRGRDIDDIL